MNPTLAIYGTRPEYLKIGPILRANDSIKSLFIKQHTDIIDFGVANHMVDISDVCSNRLNSIFSQIFLKAEKVIDLYKNIIIQGDTATVAACALVAYHLKKEIIYIESGLRSFDMQNPYPEEGYRQIVSRLANVNFCPTLLSAANLRQEKIIGKIITVGNTGLDNLLPYKNKTSYSNKILITLHRTENISLLSDWFSEIDKAAAQHPQIEFIYPVHPNPQVAQKARSLKHVKTVPPLEHRALLDLLKDCRLVITDSGGIQEEASFLNKKIIVCRKVTERPEGIDSGHLHLCPAPSFFLDIFSDTFYNYQINAKCPYGDGRSAPKIINMLKNV
jgi:UDP-N-acetylglucosamine 2-epimerase (non-hydrolysing)|tara:strand:+ start:2629 stop:3624 length:996 start_codon:yes stop_codon:yes gene_type:complete